MNVKALFDMIFSVDFRDRNLAEGIIENLIETNNIEALSELNNLLCQYHDYPGYDIVVDKERIEDKLTEYIKNVMPRYIKD
jgi:hypothetical protein